jgi:hypothetical protein
MIFTDVSFKESLVAYSRLNGTVVFYLLFSNTLILIPNLIYVVCWFKPLQPSIRIYYRRTTWLSVLASLLSREKVIFSLSIHPNIKYSGIKNKTIGVILQIIWKLFIRTILYSFAAACFVSIIRYGIYEIDHSLPIGTQIIRVLVYALFGNGGYVSGVLLFLAMLTVFIAFIGMISKLGKNIEDKVSLLDALLVKSKIINIFVTGILKLFHADNVRYSIIRLLEISNYMHNGKQIIINYNKDEFQQVTKSPGCKELEMKK